MSAAAAPSITSIIGRTRGCTDACRLISFFQSGVFGRQSAVLHDAEAHEQFGADCATTGSPDRVVRSGRLSVDLGTLTIWVDGRVAHLSPSQTRLLVELARHAGRVVSYDDLIRSGLGHDPLWWSHHNLRALTSRMRVRLGPAAARIEAHDGLGYRLLTDGEADVPVLIRGGRAS